jgi:hypothetical protein
VDTAFLILVLVSLSLLSGLIVCRMGASGASAGRVILALVELWLAFALWVAIFRGIAAQVGVPAGEGPLAELGVLGRGLATLSAASRGLVAGGLGVSLAMLVHLLWRLVTSDLRVG